jgi:hypothetical protein
MVPDKDPYHDALDLREPKNAARALRFMERDEVDPEDPPHYSEIIPVMRRRPKPKTKKGKVKKGRGK